MISLEDGKKLIQLARNSVISALNNKEFTIDSYLSEKFSEKQGVFVTLHLNNDLRGCIGFPEPVFPLFEAIQKAAVSAAFEDPRFRPVSEEEYDLLSFELSVLTIPEEITTKPEEYTKLIEIGKHGLIIKSMFGSGLLLPQVFTEYNCTPESALEMVCEKAGLAKDTWKDEKNKIFTFSAQIFSEENKKVVEKS